MPSPRPTERSVDALADRLASLTRRFTKTQLLAFFVLKKVVWVVVALYWVI